MEVEPAGQPGAPEESKHPDLYFADGDVVLSAKYKDGSNTLFRVHRIMLSHFSQVFKDMFSLPTHPQANDMYEGVPMIQMPDEGEDLCEFIRTLYHPE